MDPRVLDALTIASFAVAPEAGAATWAVRVYARMMILQTIIGVIAAEGAARQVKQELPAKLTTPLSARVPTVQEMHKQVQKMACDGVEKSLRRAGHSVTRHGSRFTVRESS